MDRAALRPFTATLIELRHQPCGFSVLDKPLEQRRELLRPDASSSSPGRPPPGSTTRPPLGDVVERVLAEDLAVVAEQEIAAGTRVRVSRERRHAWSPSGLPVALEQAGFTLGRAARRAA